MDSKGLNSLSTTETHCKICLHRLMNKKKCGRCVDARYRSCPLCGFISVSINARYRHFSICRLSSDSIRISGGVVCVRCALKCQTIAELNWHLRKCKKKCAVCDKEFKYGALTTRHEASVHGVNPGHKFKGGVCDKCGADFVAKRKLLLHVTSCIVYGVEHKNQIGMTETSHFQSFTFHSEAAFDRWLENLQIETKTYFAKQSGTKGKLSHKKYKYLYCQHSRIAKTDIERKTNRKRKSGLLPYYACPARMSVKINQHETTVKFYSNHSHPITEESLKYQPFPISVRKAVKRQISKGISSRIILQDVKSQYSKWKSTSNEPNKISLLSKPYVDKMRYTQKMLKEAGRLSEHPSSEEDENGTPVSNWNDNEVDPLEETPNSGLPQPKQGVEEAFCNFTVEGSDLSFAGTLTSQDFLLTETSPSKTEVPKAQIYVIFANK